MDGFGHSDLLIGEESCEKVFPRFVSHMKLAEEGVRKEETDCRKEAALSWDGSHDSTGGLGAWIDLLFFLGFIAIFFFYLIPDW